MSRYIAKKAVRAVVKSHYNDHTAPIFKQLNILKLTDLHELHTCIFMYDFVNGSLPRPLQSLFEIPDANNP